MSLEKFSKLLSEASPGKSFKTESGELASLGDLRKALSERGASFYHSYANNNENHFANWVEGVFEDRELAGALRNAQNYEKALKVIDDRLRYAELWLNYNSKKETLNNYLADGDLSMNKLMNSQEFIPEHHRFETVFDMDLHSITKVTPPKTTFLTNFSSFFQKKEPEGIPESEVLKNAVVLEPRTVIRHKSSIESEEEQKTQVLMESLFPGAKVTRIDQVKNFFAGVISRFWK